MSKKNNNKSAFTLAEVFITLGIIGVVAALTIPIIIAKNQKAQTLSQLKKVYSVLDNAYNMAVVENGPIEGWGFTGISTNPGMQSVYENMFAPHLSISKYCGTTNTNNICWAYGYNIDGTAGSVRPDNQYNGIYTVLSDGTSVVFRDTTPGGLTVIRFLIYIDINGLKLPNRLGKDRFVFTVASDRTHYKLLPYGVDINFPTTEPDREACWDASADDGAMPSGSAGKGISCAYTIFKDNWQIADDYPF